MAKKKNKKNQQTQQPLSAEKFIQQRARLSKIGPCYVYDRLEEDGEGHVIVSRLHGNGWVTVGYYLVDIWCLGVKDTFYHYRLTTDEFSEFIEKYPLGLRECSYEEAHNWIYGAIAFAEEASISPHKSFKLTRYILEEDTDDIPLIEYEFGKDGKHFLVAKSQQEANLYLPLLQRTLGEGNYDFILNDEDDDDLWFDDEDEDWDDDDDDDLWFDDEENDDELYDDYEEIKE